MNHDPAMRVLFHGNYARSTFAISKSGWVWTKMQEDLPDLGSSSPDLD